MNKTSFSFLLSIAAIALAAVSIAGMFLLTSQKGAVEQKEKAPQFFWKDFETGEALHLETLRGKVVLLNYWAKWCIFCVREMPALEKLSREYKDRGLVVLGIHRSDTETTEAGNKFAEELGVTFKLLSDGKTGNSYAYFSRGSQWMPTSVIIDREGFISEIIFGDRNESQWRALVEPVLR